MKKIATVILSLLMICGCLFGCGSKTQPSQPDDAIITDKASLSYAFDGVYKNGELKDTDGGFNSAGDLVGGRYSINGTYRSSFTEINTRNDIKVELYNDRAVRIVNMSGGYAFTLPTTEVDCDYSIAQYRTQYSFGSSVLSVSVESSNPYTSRPAPWYTYCSEWVIRRINDDKYLAKNGLERLNGTQPYDFTETNFYGDRDIKQGYDVYRYDIKVTDEDDGIDRPYYNIRIVRPESDVKTFILFVMKSSEDRADVMDGVVDSYTKISPKGVQRIVLDAGEAKQNPGWNDATKQYFESLCGSDYVNWGAFNYSMPSTETGRVKGDTVYNQYYTNSVEAQSAVEEIWGHKFDIYPTYTHLGGDNGLSTRLFPLDMARELAGGNGKNGKPVLQFTYQFTLDNNNVETLSTPLFDIMRGKYDERFRTLARDIKAYGEPVLFRLNNEMNTDWTSYCGMMTLLDPDVFTMTWRRLYDIFEDEGVDNTIWIWNPMGKSYPYSSWGEDLCYFPGVDYVQLLGGTCYEFNNYAADAAASSIVSFKKHYSELYDKNKTVFAKWKMIISEFACGSGGEATGASGRNAALQAKWIEDMFDELNAADKEPWVASIKGAVWFNADDVAGGKVTNRLCFYHREKDYSDLDATRAAFKTGFAAGKKG